MSNYKFTEADNRFMEMAAHLAERNVENGGGPFGAVIVKDGEVVATGVNRVTSNNDPTAHAEVSAIRSACQKLGSFKLDGCIVYSSCEPCPMCLSALYWAGVKAIVYGNIKEDADSIGFGDKFIYEEIDRQPSERTIPCYHLSNSHTPVAFDMWRNKEDKVEY